MNIPVPPVEWLLDGTNTVRDLRVWMEGRVPENAKISVRTEEPAAILFSWER